MVRSDYKFWVQTKGSSVLTWLPHRSVASLWFSPHHLICNFSPIQYPLRKSKLTFLLDCCSAHLSRSPGCLKLLISFPLSIFGHQSPGPASLPGHHKNHLIGVESSLTASLEIYLSFECLLAIAHAVQPPRLAITRTIWLDSSLTVPTWVAFGHRSRGPASLPDYRQNLLIWVDSIRVVPLAFYANSPLSFPEIHL
jgi:hypothetical protein